jgi:hypothetical protein
MEQVSALAIKTKVLSSCLAVLFQSHLIETPWSSWDWEVCQNCVHAKRDSYRPPPPLHKCVPHHALGVIILLLTAQGVQWAFISVTNQTNKTSARAVTSFGEITRAFCCDMS